MADDPLTARRLSCRVNTVYLAEYTGYVSIFFTGGWMSRVELVAGPENPPTEVISALEGELNSYAGGVIRRGEYWMARAKRDKAGVQCVFTPFAA